MQWMPDPSKHAALEAIGFTIQPICGTCAHWEGEGLQWGHCKRAPYTHGKHTDPGLAGTPAIGGCPKHLPYKPTVLRLAGSDYAERYT